MTLLLINSSILNAPSVKGFLKRTSLQLFVFELFISKVIPGEIITCLTKHEVNFDFPDCPKNSCRLMKLPEKELIVRDGIISQYYLRYSFNEQRNSILLIRCTEDDGGEYLWSCMDCNITKNIYLKIRHDKSERLKCAVGGQLSFKCPCCPQEFGSSKFKKLFRKGFIMHDGVLVDSGRYDNRTKYQNSDKTHVVLKDCAEDDEGTYVWMCGKSEVNKHFRVDVHHQHSKVEAHSATRGIPRPTSISLLPIFVLFLNSELNTFFWLKV